MAGWGPPGVAVDQVTSANQNPNFDFRYDNPGSRFLLQNSLIGALGIALWIAIDAARSGT